jgi:hypothetical protein
LVLTMPARGSFGIIARHKGVVVISASSCRTRRVHGRTSEALDEATQIPLPTKGEYYTKTLDNFPHQH